MAHRNAPLSEAGTGLPVPHYDRERPGDLAHVDVKKLGNIPAAAATAACPAVARRFRRPR